MERQADADGDNKGRSILKYSKLIQDPIIPFNPAQEGGEPQHRWQGWPFGLEKSFLRSFSFKQMQRKVMGSLLTIQWWWTQVPIAEWMTSGGQKERPRPTFADWFMLVS